MILVRNNFLADPKAERERALAAVYETIQHNGLTYRGMSEQAEGPECAEIRAILGFHRGKIVTGYRRYLADEENETYIHSDANIAKWTAVLYLNEPDQCQGGTAFWRYRPYNWVGLPTAEGLAAQGLEDEPSLWDRVLADGHDERKWEMHNYVPLGWNRLILFDSRLFHSRYPKRSFGTSVADARLIKLFFITP